MFVRFFRWARIGFTSPLVLSVLALAWAPVPALHAQDISLSLGDLESGSSVTVEFLVTVDDPVSAGATLVENQGELTGDQLDAVATDDPAAPGADDPTTTPLRVLVDLRVAMTETIDPVIAGTGTGNLAYEVTVANVGSNFATGVVLEDVLTLPAGAAFVSAAPSHGSFSSPTWTIGTIDPGDTAFLIVMVTVAPSAVPGDDVICNTAELVAIDQVIVSPGDTTASECTSIARQVDLQVEVAESTDPVIAGAGPGNLSYVVTMTNDGPSDASGITSDVGLPLPAGVTTASVVPGQGSFAGDTWSVGDLAAGASATLTVTLDVAASAPVGTDTICATATVTGSNEPRISTSDDSDTECTSIAREIDLRLSKTESVDPVIAGAGGLTYVVTVTNAGPSDATAVTLSATTTRPAGVSVSSVVPSHGSYADPTWTLGDLAAGAGATLTVTLAVEASAVPATDAICDTTTVTGSTEPRIATGDDSATECTSIAREIDLQVSITESVDPVAAGSGAGNLAYVVTVTNAGPSDASAVALAESLTLPAGVSVDSIVPSQGGFVDPTWTVGDLAAGADATLALTLTVGPTAAVGTDTICATATVTGSTEPRTLPADDSDTECTSVTVEADLAITKVDDADPPAAGANLVYTLTVTNLGPSSATGVVVTDPLPPEVTYVSDTCGGADLAPWTWNVGTLAVGASIECDVEVAIPAPLPASISNTAGVTGDPADPVAGNDSDTETTTLDAVPPTVTGIDSVPGTGDGSLDECEAARAAISWIRVTFSEPLADPPGDTDPGDVTNPQSYLLVTPGPNGFFDTETCAGPAGDDVASDLAAVRYSAATRRASLDRVGEPLTHGVFRLLVCDSLGDAAGNALDGDADGTKGGDFRRQFRVDRGNLFRNGHFDCGLADWQQVENAPSEIEHEPGIDADNVVESGSARLTSGGGDQLLGLSQCAPIVGGHSYPLLSRFRLELTTPPPAALVSYVRTCEFFSQAGCAGELSAHATRTETFASGTTGSDFRTFEDLLDVPAGTSSLRCHLALVSKSRPFTAYLDGLRLLGDLPIFADGFESGDLGAWSHEVP